MMPVLISQATPIVFVVDDDLSVRGSLEYLIRFEGWHPVTFGLAKEFLAHPRVFVPNCLVLDVSLPDLNGLEVQGRIAIERPDMPIIFITGYSDVPTTVRAMKAGALEFLTKPLNADLLLTAIRAGLEHSRVALSREIEIELIRNRCASLSIREHQVMLLVVSGLSNRQIGNELGIAEGTVKTHRGRVMEKMNAGSIPDLVKMARRLAFLETGDELSHSQVDDSEDFE
jgi:FixJ family two-component response regulator